MDVQKKKKIIIIILVVFILLIIGILFTFSKSKSADNIVEDNGNEIIDNSKNVIEQNVNNIIDDSINVVEENENKVVISNNSLNEETLNDLLRIIGIEKDNKNVNNCLNINLSNNNYMEKKREMFSWYASMNKLNTYRYNEDKCQASTECKLAYSCGACSSILKDDANKILKIYGFDMFNIDFLEELPEYDSDYRYSSVSCCGAECPYYISHNISTKIVNDDDIKIIDKQILKEYDRDSKNIINTKNQTVIYEFNKYGDGSYYLYNVNVVVNDSNNVTYYEGFDPWNNSLIVVIKSIDNNKIVWSIFNKYYEQEVSSVLNDKVANFSIKGNSKKSGLNVNVDYSGILTLNEDSVTIKFESGQLTTISSTGGGGFMMAGAIEENSKTVTLNKVK